MEVVSSLVECPIWTHKSTCKLEIVWCTCTVALIFLIRVQLTSCPWMLRQIVNFRSCMPDSPGAVNPDFAWVSHWEETCSSIVTTKHQALRLWNAICEWLCHACRVVLAMLQLSAMRAACRLLQVEANVKNFTISLGQSLRSRDSLSHFISILQMFNEVLLCVECPGKYNDGQDVIPPFDKFKRYFDHLVRNSICFCMTLMTEFFSPSTYHKQTVNFLPSVCPGANGWTMAAYYSNKDCAALLFGGSQSWLHIRTWGAFKHTKSKATPQRTKSGSLGLRRRQQYFLWSFWWHQCAASIENQCSRA